MKPQTFSIPGVEIFSAGNWNGDDYTVDDLNEMVRAFNENKVGARPHLKLGHDDKQTLLQRDGLPAAGWIERVYVVGEKLVADFVDIPEKIYKLIVNRAYRKVSSEIFWNIKIGEKLYSRMLAAVALLGADNPGVMNLNDILACYKKYNGNFEKLTLDNDLEFELDSSEQKQKGKKKMEKTEKEIKLEYDLSQKETQLKEASEKLDAANKAQKEKDDELAALKKFKAEAEQEKAKLLAEKETARLEKFVSDLQSEKLCTPGMKPLVLELVGPEKKEYSLKDKKVSKEDLMKEVLKLFKASADVNFEENSEAGDEGQKKNKEQEQLEAINKYMSEHKCSYSVAAKAILSQNKK